MQVDGNGAGRPELVDRALRAAPAYSLPEALGAAVGELFPAAGPVRVLLADYRLRVLLPADPGPSGERPEIPVHDTIAGRTFASLTPLLDRAPERVLYVPLTARGERLGVLAVPFTGEPEPADRADLTEIGRRTGEALAVAWRHTDRYERARRRRRMSLPAELQWQLLPGRSVAGAAFDLAGHLEPAYSIGGDGYDWASESDHLALTVVNGSGTGIRAALLTSLTIGALRNARRSGADLAEQVSLAGDTVYGRYGGAEFTETLVMRIEPATGAVEAIDAGSPRILRMRGSRVAPIELERQLPPGMFADTEYRPERFHLEPGDRLVIVSDGVFGGIEGIPPFQVDKAVRRTRLLPAAEVPLSIIAALLDHRRGGELADDAVVVCLDWRGEATRTGAGAGPGEPGR